MLRSRKNSPLTCLPVGKAGGQAMLKNGLKELLQCVLNFIFPIGCTGCGKENTYGCPNCLEKIPLEAPGAPPISIPPLDGLFFVSRHKEKSMLAKLIHRFKYDGAKEIGPLLSKLAVKAFGAQSPTTGRSGVAARRILIPVPLHRRRKNFRGFNQSEILALEMGKSWNLPVQNLLRRTRYTRPQMELKEKERLQNLCGAFELADPRSVPDPAAEYFLVDDVCTTGSTLGECAKILKANGAKIVYGIAVAKT